MEKELRIQGSVKKFAGIDIPDGLTRTNFFTLYLASWIMGCLMALPAVIQPVFLKVTIGIPEELAGSINSGLQNMSQLATLALIGMVGVASDRYGRRILVITGFILCCVFYIVFGHSRDIALALGIGSVGGQVFCVYLIRFVIGIGLVLSHPQFVTMVADYTFEKGRGKGMALHAIMMSLGALSVYGLFTQIATKIGILGLLYIGGFLALWGILIARLGLVDRMPEEKIKKAGIKEIYRAVSKSFALKLSYIAAFVTRADIVIPSTLLIVWMVSVADKFGYTPLEATARGGIILMVGSLFRLLSFSAVGVMLDRIGRTPVLIATLLTGGIGYFLVATTDNPFSDTMFIYVCLLGFGKNGAIVAANTLASDVAPRPMRGSILGGLNTVGTLGIILFLQACGYLFDNFSCGSPFLLKGAVNLLFGIWVWVVRDRILVGHRTQKTQE
jgi:MFS family permease